MTGRIAAVSQPLCGAFPSANQSCFWNLWAPAAREVNLVLFDELGAQFKHRMHDRGDGHLTFEADGIPAGQRYAFELPSGVIRPDPASRWQPDGVHAPSAVWNADDFPWTDRSWRGVAREDLVLYELHVGTFTAEGTFAAIKPRLNRLRDLGITAIELMPVAQFPGRKNWGYDGTYWYAVQNSYGGPRELQSFVDACHQAGLGVFLDVVYNHLGPEGNYLAEFGPYFTDQSTPWGRALNFDGAGSEGVRAFLLNNVRQWIRDFHIDGLRLDAAHAIQDRSTSHILSEVKTVTDEEASYLDKVVHLVGEYHLPPLQQSAPDGPAQVFDVLWKDDFHHCVHTLLTAENQGYYRNYTEPLLQLRNIMNHSSPDNASAGSSPKAQPVTSQTAWTGSRYIISIQNHDQIGNRALAERLSQLVPLNGLRFAAALLLLAPNVPMLFMGEEYGESKPFPFFCDFSDPRLNTAVRAGRRLEFADFQWPEEIPDPLDNATFESAVLDWQQSSGRPGEEGLSQLYRDLLRARRRLPALRDFHHCEAQLIAASQDETVLKIVRGDPQHPDSQIEAFFNPHRSTVILPATARPRHPILLSSEEVKYGGWKRTGRLSWDLSPFECIVVGKNPGGT